MELSSLSRLMMSLSLTLVLSACGGGGDDTSINNNNDDSNSGTPSATMTRCDTLAGQDASTQSSLTTVSTNSALQFQIEATYYAQQSGAILTQINTNNSPLNSVDYQFNWQQLSGEPLVLISPHSPLLAFEAPRSGTYTLQVHISTQSETWSESISIDVEAAKTNNAHIRVSHQVTQGSLVSLRYYAMSDTMTNLSWCIADGPDLLVDLSEIDRPLFSAPAVSQDTISTLRAMAIIDGAEVNDDVYLLITFENAITSDYFPQPLARTFAYQPSSPYADAIQACVYSNQLNESCLLTTLPLIGQQDNADAMKAAIEDRLLVSHQWMGDNFMFFLEQMDPQDDFLTLLQSVTAIVISEDIRPSFYWAQTGAIYVDPDNLWLTASERDTINEQPDYRSQFGESLDFLMPWRYVQNNDYASQYFSIAARSPRSLEALTPDLASLLYHELAHANDYFPISLHSQLQGPRLIDDYQWISNDQLSISDQLISQIPLTSDVMHALANVSFRGESATQTQQAYTPSDISAFFSADAASDYYAYTSQQEDMAMLFEEAMMSDRFNIQRDVAVTDKPTNPTANNILVHWGQRGRIGEDKVAERFAIVGTSILPTLDTQALLASLPEPVLLIVGDTWAQNVVQAPTLSNSQMNTLNKTQARDDVDTSAEIGVSRPHPPLKLSGER
ncbi:DUF3324 domain-containing protein [Shewanella surugensis]|uniref:DUF3324 domain-containing protein n=1 Tax=Shewanella surugensis TaxID=212020 RepID=A0ABT0LFB2_9GAMM|nr:DUF3324 domain-containing protein [Shewanella surugensis]MCL1126397.1 DUF3324 domain-containing protein [Shewanella surugensis]